MVLLQLPCPSSSRNCRMMIGNDNRATAGSTAAIDSRATAGTAIGDPATVGTAIDRNIADR